MQDLTKEERMIEILRLIRPKVEIIPPQVSPQEVRLSVPQLMNVAGVDHYQDMLNVLELLKVEGLVTRYRTYQPYE